MTVGQIYASANDLRVVTRVYLLRRVGCQLRLFAFTNIVPQSPNACSQCNNGGSTSYMATSATTPVVLPVQTVTAADASAASASPDASTASAAGYTDSYSHYSGLSAYSASAAMDARYVHICRVDAQTLEYCHSCGDIRTSSH